VGILEILGVAGSLSLLAGWRLYAAVFVTGLAMKLGWLDLPSHLSALTVLSHSWVLAAAGTGALAEFFADKIAWVDSLWDGIHTLVRPLGGALLALAVVDPSDPAMQVVAFLLGGGAALLGHGAKAGTRALVNTSPEPFSNIAVSAVEDVATTAGFALVLTHPLIALGLALTLTGLFAWLLWKGWRLIRPRRALADDGEG
jgi:Domain of unknown function (DUF4126)